MPLYWGNGAAMKAEFLQQNRPDPIFDMKPWPEHGMAINETVNDTGQEANPLADNTQVRQRNARHDSRISSLPA
jgi:hypothetical protein